MSNKKNLRQIENIHQFNGLKYLPVIFLHAEDPSTQDIVWYMKLLYQIALFEHSDGSTARVFVGEVEVDEREAVEIERLRGRYGVGGQSQGIVVISSRVITQTFEGNLLFRHQLAGGLVHLRVVNAEAAKMANASNIETSESVKDVPLSCK